MGPAPTSRSSAPQLPSSLEPPAAAATAVRVVASEKPNARPKPHSEKPWSASHQPFLLAVISHFLCAFGFSVFSLFPKYLMTARALSQADTGPITMGFPLGALLFSPLLALAMGRFPKAQIVRVCILLYCSLTAVFIMAPAPAIMPLLSFLIGGACMGVFNGGAGLVADTAPQQAMARALGLHGAAGMLGHALGPLVMEPLAARFGWSASFGLAVGSAFSASLLPLAHNQPHGGGFSLSWGFLRPLSAVLVVTLFAGLMHNALWTAHQPLVLARGGHEMRGYFLGMSGGALLMRVLFGGLPDRIGRARAALYALALYVVAAAGMTLVTPETLPGFGLVHGVAHGVFYPAIAALATASVALNLRGEALIAIYAAFNVGATLGSVGFARFGQAFGPAAVFPLAAALGLVGLFTLWARVPRAQTSAS